MTSELAARVESITQRVAVACARSGRTIDGVKMVAASKSFGPDVVEDAAGLGLNVFGESKVQEAAAKIPLCRGGLSWHFIGHLQTNKIRPALELFDMFHAVDSLKLLLALEQAADVSGRRVTACVEVNVSGERSKNGLAPNELMTFMERAAGLSRVQIVGLMTIPPFSEEAEDARPFFVTLRELRDKARTHSGLALPELSMGMTHDFEVAIEEGATWIRIGTGIFGARKGSWQRMRGTGTEEIE